ncbi:MAG: BREX-1 system adenine-specific DNA-methyltransferase PglX, partial [Clostridiaceae bacterium]|nr:BREX-1 system adenine-specific DNA-methyltransferase PglX [Clostridiaceae bacterium]
MNKTAIKNFAIWARNKLIADITYKAGLLGITEKEIKNPLPQSTKDVQFFDIGTKEPYSITGAEIVQRRKLAEAIQQKVKQSDYKIAYKSVIEEVAYTWFNRLIAVRFMEVNDYLPTRIRVLSSESSTKIEPDLVTSPFDADLDYSPYEKDRIMQLKNDNQLDELFRMLFIKQCNALNAILPELFEKTNDYTELLMNVSFTDKDGVVYRLVNDIPEDDFNVAKEGQVEIIGWLYQYYNTEPKQAVFDGLKKNVKITKENIPAATQLFTPDWIVRYMVENSLGRLWLERERASSGLSDEYLNGSYFGWKYYLEEAEQEPEVKAELVKIREEYKDIKPEDIKVIDPCMGSGHILVYAFDVLMQIYESYGYSQRDAAKLILEKNLYGLEIDRRAYQLAYFALMMKARQYNRRILALGVRPQVYEPTGYGDGMEYGSLVRVDQLEPMPEPPKENQMTLFEGNYDAKLNAWHFRRLLAQKYDVVATNPPYAGSSGLNGNAAEFLKDNYPDTKSDMFAAFIERCCEFVKAKGFVAMITQQAWMFLSSYEVLRAKLASGYTCNNMIHLGNGAFGFADFGITSFIYCKYRIKDYLGTYVRLVEENNPEWKESEFLKGHHRHIANTNDFDKIPGSPVVYWISKAIQQAFENGIPIEKIADVKRGMTTSDNNRFLRFWAEVDFTEMRTGAKSADDAEESGCTWFPYSKGGGYRKWYGYHEYVIDWKNNGERVIDFAKTINKSYTRTIVNIPYYFKPSVGFCYITMGPFSMRWIPEGFIYDSGGPGMFSDLITRKKLLGLMNSKPAQVILKLISPTINLQIADIIRMPFLFVETELNRTEELVDYNVTLSRSDWDAFETSWNFTCHPL